MKRKIKKTGGNLEYLTFSNSDIFKIDVDLTNFNKVYLSNTVENLYSYIKKDFSKVREQLFSFFNKFQKGTIFYFLMENLTNIYAPGYYNIVGQDSNFKSEIKEGRHWTYCKCEKIA